MLLYFFAALLSLPVAFCAPMVMLWVVFRYRPTRGEVLRLVAVCWPTLVLAYVLMSGFEYVLVRPIAVEVVTGAATILVFRAPMPRKVMSLLVALMLMVIGETIAYQFMSIFYPQYLSNYIPWRTMLMNLIPFSMPYLVFGAVLLLRRAYKPAWQPSPPRLLFNSIAPVLLFISALAVVLETEGIKLYGAQPRNLELLLWYALIMMLSACVTCVMLVSIYQRERAKSDTLLHYQQTIANQYDSTRVFRHNYRNTLLMLNGYHRAGDYAALGELLQSMNQEYEAVYSSEYAQGVEAIEDRGIQWLVISKLVHAQSQGIDCAVQVTGSVRSVALSAAEVAELLGILLDNAIEAAARSAARQMGLSVQRREDALVLAVRNSVDAPPDLPRLFDKGYSTKPGHTGLGLYRLRQLLRRYPQSLTDVRLQDGMFIFTVSI